MSEASMIDRVARAIRSKVPQGYGMTKLEAKEYARASIEAMREPTEAMCFAVINEGDCYLSYQQMIDEALK